MIDRPLVGQIIFKQNGTTRMTTTKSYDYLNRLTSISSVGGASSASPISFNYNYNPANQRTRSSLADGSYWRYEYDALGQVRRGARFWAEGTPVAGQQFEYGYDDIGNRTNSKAGGDQNGMNLRSAGYAANTLNQYTSRDVPGAVDVMGIALATNTVTVNGQATYRKVEYFRKELSVANSSVPVWQSVTVAAAGESTVNGYTFVPKSPEQFAYDLDGNLTSDGRWTYAWDAENRLLTLVALTSVGPQQSIRFDYDAQGRRIRKRVWNNLTFSDPPTVDQRFVYDDWNLTAILNPQSSILASFVWGNDLSGSIQGAGGVGGLLEVSYYGSSTTNCFLAYDGNGNVAALITADGTLAANYDYGPFGELIRATGPMAKNNPFRFSTKYQDDETDLIYYGYRYYKPSTGTWPNRDPLEETGGRNLYAFVANSPTTSIDKLGHYHITWYNGVITTCGGWHALWWIHTDLPEDGDYWVVQEISENAIYLHCNYLPDASFDHWFEAFEVSPAPAGKMNLVTDFDNQPAIPQSIGIGRLVTCLSKIFEKTDPITTECFIVGDASGCSRCY